MGNGLESLGQAYNVLFTAVLIVLALLVMLCLVRAVKGPTTADRVVSVNMMGTMVIVIIAILSIMLGEGYLIDICIIYALISFLAVIVLTKVYMGVYREKEAAAAAKASVEQMTGTGPLAEWMAEKRERETRTAEVKEDAGRTAEIRENGAQGGAE